MSNARYSRKDIKDAKEFFGKLDKIIDVVGDEVSTFKGEEIETVPVQLMKSLILQTKGKITGKEYIFNGAGSIVYVDKEDAEEMKKNVTLRQSCCGSYSIPYFKFL